MSAFGSFFMFLIGILIANNYMCVRRAGAGRASSMLRPRWRRTPPPLALPHTRAALLPPTHLPPLTHAAQRGCSPASARCRVSLEPPPPPCRQQHALASSFSG
jgi:hypothetical protein